MAAVCWLEKHLTDEPNEEQESTAKSIKTHDTNA